MLSLLLFKFYCFSQWSVLVLAAEFCYLFCSYAEMSKEEKNKISHRSRALALVKAHFAEAAYTFETNSST